MAEWLRNRNACYQQWVRSGVRSIYRHIRFEDMFIYLGYVLRYYLHPQLRPINWILCTTRGEVCLHYPSLSFSSTPLSAIKFSSQSLREAVGMGYSQTRAPYLDSIIELNVFTALWQQIDFTVASSREIHMARILSFVTLRDIQLNGDHPPFYGLIPNSCHLRQRHRTYH